MDQGYLANRKTHHHHRIADIQTGRAVDKGMKWRLDEKPALALGCVVNVVAESKQQQRRRQKNKPAHGALHFVQAHAELRGQVLQWHNFLDCGCDRFGQQFFYGAAAGGCHLGPGTERGKGFFLQHGKFALRILPCAQIARRHRQRHRSSAKIFVAAPELVQKLQQPVSMPCVQTAERIIEQQQFRLQNQRPRQRRAPPPVRGDVCRRGVRERSQLQQFQQNNNFTSEIIEDYNQSGKHVFGHQLFHDATTGSYRCFDWNASQQRHVAIECPESEESHEAPKESPKSNREEVMQHLAAARQTAEAEQKSQQVKPNGPATTSNKEVGVVVPARLRPGQRVSGRVVDDPDRFAGQPELTVVRVTLPLEPTGDSWWLGGWTFGLKGRSEERRV